MGKDISKIDLEQVSGAIMTSFINLHYLEDIASKGLFRQRVKNNIKRTITDLIDIENSYFAKVEEVDENDLADKLVANNMQFVEWLLRNFKFNDFTKLQEVCLAYSYDKDKVEAVSNEILKQNGAKEL